MTDKKSIFPPTSMAHEKPNFPSLSPELRLAEDARFSEATRDSFFPTTSMGTDTTITLGTKTKTAPNEATAQKEQVADSAATSPSAAVEAPRVSSKEETLPKVFCKSCRAPRGTTKAGTTNEPLLNFGDMALLQSPPEELQAGSQLDTMAQAGLLVAKGATEIAKLELPKLGSMGLSVNGVASRVPWLALFYSSSLGDGTLASIPELSQMSTIDTRVKFRFVTDASGKETLTGYHVGDGFHGYGEPVKVIHAEESTDPVKSYIADLGDGVKITWLPEERDKTPLSTPLPWSDRLDPSTILVRPIESEDITTTIYPEEELMELIVTFPASSGLKPLYLVFQARGPDGRFISTGEPKSDLTRPSLRAETKRKIQGAADKDEHGNFIDEDKNIITDWHYGHKYGHEHRRLVKAADQLELTQAQFNDFVNAFPEYFQIEDEKANLSHKGEKQGSGDLEYIIMDMEDFFDL